MAETQEDILCLDSNLSLERQRNVADDHDAIQPAGAQASQAPEGRSGQEELIPAGKIPKHLVKPEEEVAGLQEESEILEQGKRIRIPLSFDAMDDKAAPIAGGRGGRSIGDDVHLKILTGNPGEKIREHPVLPPDKRGREVRPDQADSYHGPIPERVSPNPKSSPADPAGGLRFRRGSTPARGRQGPLPCQGERPLPGPLLFPGNAARWEKFLLSEGAWIV